MSHSRLRKRDKPLRTYGKRSASAPDAPGEPPSKKSRLADWGTTVKEELSVLADRNDSADASERKEHADSAPPSPQAGGPHASILSYFKPLAQAPLLELLEEAPRGKPPWKLSHRATAPDAAHARCKPRLLRLRAASLPSSDSKETRSDGASEDKRDEVVEEKGRHQATSDSEEERGLGMHDVGGRLLDKTRENGNTDLDASIKVRQSRRVQTTLNISARAAFAECRVCNTVWNPLYPDDVKYHAKHHATVLRTRNRKQDGL